jgi:hypothetical protein
LIPSPHATSPEELQRRSRNKKALLRNRAFSHWVLGVRSEAQTHDDILAGNVN